MYGFKSSAIPTTPGFIFFLGAGLKGIALGVYDFFIFDFNDERQATPFTFPLYSQRLNYFPFCLGRKVIRCGRKRDEFNIEFTVPQPMRVGWRRGECELSGYDCAEWCCRWIP